METLFFVVSGTCLFLFILGVFNRCAFPIPIISELFGITSLNSFIYAPSLIYQFYFWAKYFQLT